MSAELKSDILGDFDHSDVDLDADLMQDLEVPSPSVPQNKSWIYDR